jgi:3-oxoacyl-[acyl-carrier protein] reductase
MDKALASFALDGKIALVTGAATGLGKATAEVLAECGAHVIVNHFRQADAAGEVVDALARHGFRACPMEADVSSEESVDRLFNDIRREHGRLDILVNNAGIARPQDIFATSLDEWNEVLAVNLTGCFLCCRRAMEIMKEQASGRIVNISSVAAHRGSLYGPVHYAASKSGILGVTKSLARTGAPLGINVNAVAPGLIGTELLYKTNGKEAVDKLESEIPLGLGVPRDVGLAVAFLSGDASRYITGATLDVNGGTYLR